MLPIFASRGDLTITRGAETPQFGQSCGARYSAIGRCAVKTPQVPQE
jgi:hypothetical protein